MKNPIRRIYCPVCQSNNFCVLTEQPVPAGTNFLVKSYTKAKSFPAVNLKLVYCKNCHFTFNGNYAAKHLDYSQNYNNDVSNSAYYLNHLNQVAVYLNQNVALKDSRILELGCGFDALFLRTLTKYQPKRLVGYDPALTPATLKLNNTQIYLLAKPFTRTAGGGRKLEDYHLLICRHTLEHIPEPNRFLDDIFQILIPVLNQHPLAVYFEVPNLDWILKKGMNIDFVYEHINYFNRESLSYLFSKYGTKFQFKLSYGGQYISLFGECKLAQSGRQPTFIKLNSTVWDRNLFLFKQHQTDVQKKVRKLIISVPKKMVVWGASTKGIMLLNIFPHLAKQVAYCVDMNKAKQNGFIPVTGHRILAPEMINNEISDVLVANPNYVPEIRQWLKARNLYPKLHTL